MKDDRSPDGEPPVQQPVSRDGDATGAVTTSILGHRSLSFQLRLLAIATALPLLAMSLVLFIQMVDKERNSVRDGLLTSARTLAGLVESEIEVHAGIASTLAQSPALATGDLASFWEEARSALAFVPGTWLTLASSDGKILLATLVPYGTALPQHVAPALVERAFATRHYQVSDVLLRPASQTLTAFVEVPVFLNERPAYSLSLSLSLDRFLTLMKTRFSERHVVAIIDRQQKFVARMPDHVERVGTLSAPGWREAIARAKEGWSENISVEGHSILTGYTPTTHGWTVGVAQRETDLAKPFKQVLWSIAAAGITLLSLSLTLAWWLSARAGRGMTELAQAARAVGEGRPIAPREPVFKEADVIASALSAAAAELKVRGDLLVNVNSRLEAEVAERTRDLVAEMRRREEIEQTLRQTQKMEAIGQLTGGIAHDFNNMLTIVLGNLDTIQRRIRSLDPAVVAPLARPVDSAIQGARSAAKLTHRLLAFSRQQALAPSPVDVRGLVSGLSDMLIRTVGERIRIETVSGAGLWLAMADSNQLENALVNLVVNARDAMPDGGCITIETSNAYLDEAYVAGVGDIKAGQYVMLSVSDTGVGIPADRLEKVFEPFFTTKPSGEGTGLGLAMIHGFVKQSGGHVRIYSEVGHGTTVKIYLPRLAAGTVVAAEPVLTESVISRARLSETIVLVEDNEGVRDYAISVLEDLGYSVIAFADAETALGALNTIDRVDLLFTDVVLSGPMNGRQLADAVGKSRPALPVLYTTGYTRNAIVHQGRLDADVSLLSKPYTSRELAEKVRAVIDRAGVLTVL